MESLIIQDKKRHGRVTEFIRSQGDSLTLGRALNNDVILSDHFVAPEQLRFEYRDESWVMTVLDTTNPVLINNQLVESDEVVIHSGDELMTGRTHLVLLLSGQQVEKTRELLLTNWLYGHRLQSVLPFAVLAVFVLCTLLVDYQETSYKIKWGEKFSESLLQGFSLLIWAGCWAFVGRILRHKPNFYPQLFYTASILSVFTLSTLFEGYPEYIFNSAAIGNVIETAVYVLACAVLLKYNLLFATELKRCGTIAFAVVGLLTLFFTVVSHLDDREFTTWPEYSNVLKPPFAQWSGELAVDEYFDTLDTRFEKLDQELKEADTEKNQL